MAGGPSTPELVAAVYSAGGFGFLAAGYLSAEALRERIEATKALVGGNFGVNLFVPTPPLPESTVADRFDATRSAAAVVIAQNGVAQAQAEAPSPAAVEALLPAAPQWTDDDYATKLDIVRHSAAAAVSFTFGHPDEDDVRDLQRRGKVVAVTTTSRPGIDAVAAGPADAIIVQSHRAGGHRGGTPGIDDDSSEELGELLAYAAGRTDKTLLAAGGTGGVDDVRAALAAGATAVQVGTRFLTAEEAGTNPVHRRALLTLTDRPTALTRAFSGRWARSVRNGFVTGMGEVPEFYPYLNALTGPMRRWATAEGNAELLNLWAGTGFTACRPAPAAEIVAELTAGLTRN